MLMHRDENAIYSQIEAWYVCVSERTKRVYDARSYEYAWQKGESERKKESKAIFHVIQFHWDSFR